MPDSKSGRAVLSATGYRTTQPRVTLLPQFPVSTALQAAHVAYCSPLAGIPELGRRNQRGSKLFKRKHKTRHSRSYFKNQRITKFNSQPIVYIRFYRLLNYIFRGLTYILFFMITSEYLTSSNPLGERADPTKYTLSLHRTTTNSPGIYSIPCDSSIRIAEYFPADLGRPFSGSTMVLFKFSSVCSTCYCPDEGGEPCINQYHGS